jgi:hypothetical protein
VNVTRSTEKREPLFVAVDAIIEPSRALFQKLDELACINSLVVIRIALKCGATTPEDFANAFEGQGVSPELAISAGKVAAVNFEQWLTEKTAQPTTGIAHPINEPSVPKEIPRSTGKIVRSESEKLSLQSSHKWFEWLLVSCLAISLLVAPWRTSYRSKETLGYSVLFVAPEKRAEIDLSRYAVQVFAVTAICGIVYVKTRREPVSR